MQIERLIELRPFIAEITPIINSKKANDIPVLTDDNWSSFGQLLNTLQHPYKATVKMQKQELTPSDFFAIWTDLKLKLNKDGGDLAGLILNGMKGREKQKNIISSLPILASVYLDPRYKIMLTPREKHDACEHLTEIWRRMRAMSIGVTSSVEHNPISAAAEADAGLDNNASFSCLTDLLRAKRADSDINAAIFCADDRYALTRVDLFPPQDMLNDGVLDFWYRQKDHERNLYKLACVVNACASTQTCVERSFAGLSFILNP